MLKEEVGLSGDEGSSSPGSLGTRQRGGESKAQRWCCKDVRQVQVMERDRKTEAGLRMRSEEDRAEGERQRLGG